MSTLVSTEACTLTDGVGDDGVARLVMTGRPDLAVADQVSARISPRSGGGPPVCSSSLRVVLDSVARSRGAPAVQLPLVIRVSVAEGWGRDGTDASTLAKLNAAARSPVTDRRHLLRFGTSAPNRVSRKRNVEV